MSPAPYAKNLTVVEAAERLGVSRTTIYRLLGDGELKSMKVRRSRRIPVDAIERYERRQMRKAS